MKELMEIRCTGFSHGRPCNKLLLKGNITDGIWVVKCHKCQYTSYFGNGISYHEVFEAQEVNIHKIEMGTNIIYN